MQYTIIDKIRVSAPTWNYLQPLGNGYTNVSAAKISWLQYQTSTAGEKELLLRIPDLGLAGTRWINEKANNKYFLSMPLDTSAQSTYTYTNPFLLMDKEYPVPISVNQLALEFFINGVPANGITTSNTVEFEIILYKKN